MRAEIMGDDETVTELKKKIERARSRQGLQKKKSQGGARASREGGEGTAKSNPRIETLIGVGRGGMIQPAQGMKIERERQAYSGKVRRVREKADPHTAGQRS